MNKKIGLLAAAVLIFYFFYAIIPVTLIHSSHFFWGFVGSILTGACLFFIGYSKPEDRYDIDNYKANNGKMTAGIIVGMLVAIFGAFVLAMHYDNREENFIKANPVVVSGTVIDGKSETTKRRGSSNTTYELNVSYKDSNAVQYKIDYDVNSTEWGNAGKGMAVSVVYERNNPEISKVLLDPKVAMDFISKDVKIFPTVKDLQTFLNTDDYNKQKKLLGKYWSVQKMEDGVEGEYTFENTVSRDNIGIMSLGNIYVNELENDVSFNAILKEAKATMKVVYDSMATNSTKGILFENDSMQIRFQKYNNSIKSESGGEYSLTYTTLKKVYCFGFAKKNKLMILPGDLKSTENESDGLPDDLKKQLEEIISKNKK